MRLRAWALATATTATTAVLLAGCSGTETDQETGAEPQGAASAGTEAADTEAGGAEAGGTKIADLATAGTKTGDLLVHGTVTSDGDPVEGAGVRVALMPEDLDSLEVGEVVPMWETPSVETGDDGRYAVRLDVEDLDEQYFKPGADLLNFDLRVEADATMAEWAATAWRVGEDGVWRSQGARVKDPVIEMSVDLAEQTIAVTDSDGETTDGELSVYDAPRAE